MEKRKLQEYLNRSRLFEARYEESNDNLGKFVIQQNIISREISLLLAFKYGRSVKSLENKTLGILVNQLKKALMGEKNM